MTAMRVAPPTVADERATLEAFLDHARGTVRTKCEGLAESDALLRKLAGWSLLQMPRIAWLSVVLFSIGVLALGMGNGAVFQLVPQRFAREIGVMTGLVGMTGGLGGFYLASSLGYSKQFTLNPAVVGLPVCAESLEQ